ncbi:GNAT family N-acetyltransferase [Bacillus sp. NTK071]|uniref:GNAT family N-acetyltransferase n=1 Tax=Bacillus sp. NTK071 TaxID=2802175 RepID=UPI001A9060A4|nr:GNAT family N-acetyltransferase [Bacillus sp. NTK071]MBN8208131.1 GNAT family N-acetyltransferase [Bacillus sp. NTK071]
MLIKIFPEMWNTKRLVINDLKDNEIHIVQKLYEQGSYIQQWDGSDFDNKYIQRCITSGDLPPNGIVEQFRIQVIRIKDTEPIVGILNTYHGHPNPETFYINYLYIDKKYQSQGLGTELVNGLLGILIQTKYDAVRANVSVKNWPAIRFWTQLGLTTIKGFFGDRVHSDSTFADIELCKQL